MGNGAERRGNVRKTARMGGKRVEILKKFSL